MKNNIARPINQLHFSALGCFTRSTMAPFPRLDTYQSERATHVREFIELAIRLGGLINTKSVEAGLAAGVRRENEPAKLEVKKPLLGPGLSAANTELTGQLAPQFALADGRRSDDVVGFRYCLLTTVAFAADLTPTVCTENLICID
jgi:3-(3-hydroxy-phenyl)propionate hydroxylase